MSIAVVDYCKGNLLSVSRWLDAADMDAVITADPDVIARADAIVLPGVGSFADASATMIATGQMEVIRQRVIRDGVPFLGICLGLQLLVPTGDEGCEPGKVAEGIGAIKGRCGRLTDTDTHGCRFKVPHVGWNSLEFSQTKASPLLSGVGEGAFFYFTHSYRVEVEDEDLVTSYTTYSERFASSVWMDNMFGTQFHPEKSSELGLAVARNFRNIVYARVS